MFQTTLFVLLPLFVVMGVGYFAGRTHRLDRHQMSGLNRVLVEFSLPAALFTGTVQTPRSELLEKLPLMLALFVVFVGVWLLTNGIARRVFRHDAGTAALVASMVAFPNTGFMGVPILGTLFGASGVTLVALATVLGMLVFIPVTVIALETRKHTNGDSPHTDVGSVAVTAFLSAARAPLVWAPLLAAGIVLLGIGLPREFLDILTLMGGITAGLAMFAAGVALAIFPLRLNFEIGVSAVLKMFVQPLLMLGLVRLMGLPALQAQEGVILVALPTGILATVLAGRYETYQAEASSTLVLTSLMLLVLLPLWRLFLG